MKKKYIYMYKIIKLPTPQRLYEVYIYLYKIIKLPASTHLKHLQ